MTQTLTTERLREIAEDGFLEHGDAKAIARELLANREAQPVGFISAKHGPALYGEHIGLPPGTHFYTAPPAPAVVRLPRAFYSDEGLMVPLEKVMASLAVCGIEYEHGGATCRAAMLAQPVSQRYKLVPVEPTDEMIAAAMNCDDVEFNSDETFCVNFDNIYRAMLAAAPEDENDTDTRR